MKKRHIIGGLLVVVVIALLVSAIQAALKRHRLTEGMEILSGFAKKMVVSSMDNGAKYPDAFTNKSFLATLTPRERKFLTENKVDIPSLTNRAIVISSSSPADTIILQVETKDGRLILFVDGSVRRDE
jgi:hypothetical protein